MFMLPEDKSDIRFPPVELASPEGLLAIGGDLAAARLLEAYRHGIFPWYSEGQPIMWWSPDPRALLYPEKIKISRSLLKLIRQKKFSVSFDRAFADVVQACSEPREQQTEEGTWITSAMMQAYLKLHEMGYAHSVEVWHENKLVGGLYGISLGHAFFGESMFSHMSNTSKIALATLAKQLKKWQFHFIDCQLPSDHLSSLGVISVSRDQFLKQLTSSLKFDDKKDRWHIDEDLWE
jgi:leucyl/phenylalanyl-tRNA--protein transferase